MGAGPSIPDLLINDSPGLSGFDPPSGSNAITLGDGNDLASFGIPVSIQTTTANTTTTLTLNDAADTATTTVTIGASSITGYGSSISYSGATSLNVLCGTGENFVLVQGTSCPTTISNATFVERQ